MLFVSFASVVSDGVDVGALVRDALTDAKMSHKEAWLQCGVDGAQWGRSLHGDAPLDLWKLRHLPFRWWAEFTPRLMSALIRAMVSELITDFRMARANVRHAHDENKEKAG